MVSLIAFGSGQEGSGHDATNVGVGSSNLSRVTNHGGLAELVDCTGLENQQTVNVSKVRIL